MEPASSKIKIYMGEFEVVQVSPIGGITINVGKKVHITIHLGDFPHIVKTGDKLPIFTEIEYAPVGPAPIQ